MSGDGPGPGLGLDNLSVADARDGLASLDDRSVDCILTSPPYWGTRGYDVGRVTWSDGSAVALGLEPDVETYLDHLGEVFGQVERVLKDSGTVWVNLGDVYASGNRNRMLRDHSSTQHTHRHATPILDKSLCLIPERFALRMSQCGWILRNKIVWAKANHAPSSVKDRFTCGWEHLFLFVKSPRYSFDLDAVRVPHATNPPSATRVLTRRPSSSPTSLIGYRAGPPTGDPARYHALGGNPGDVWVIPTRPSDRSHPAPFPEVLCERPILAGCPPGGLVVDPFVGSGTTAVVAKRLCRHFIGFDLNPAYIALARDRIARVAGSTHKGGTPEGALAA